MEMKLKEKTQESNLLDFKLRTMVRNNDLENGFLKPHSGIHAGVLSSQAGMALGATITLANQVNMRKSTRNFDMVNQSMDAARLPSK
jgi:hypothetical protein